MNVLQTELWNNLSAFKNGKNDPLLLYYVAVEFKPVGYFLSVNLIWTTIIIN